MNKNNVYKQYNLISKWFDEARSREFFEKPYIDLAISSLKKSLSTPLLS